MFRIRKEQTGLMNSKLFDEHQFFKRMSADLKISKDEIIIESPFLTVKRTKQFVLLIDKVIKRGVSVYVHTRSPDHHEGNLKDQAMQSIRLLENIGVAVHVHSDMRHRKVAIIDNRILWEGSLNMLSHSNSREIMRRSVSDEMCKEMLLCLI